MATNKRITDLTEYKSVLPYASEIFGVYQPLIGWKSKRIVQRMNKGIISGNLSKYSTLIKKFKGITDIQFNHDHYLESARVDIGAPNNISLKPQSDSILLSVISQRIQDKGFVPKNEEWVEFINENVLSEFLNKEVYETYKDYYSNTWTSNLFNIENHKLTQSLKTESAIAGVLLSLAKKGLFDKLDLMFFQSDKSEQVENIFQSMKQDFKDPFLTFDPKKDIQNVSLSPIGIVHLYRQFFFELDTFLGTPVSHVWLSPGSTVELIETASRKTITEKTIETSLESTFKSEKSSTQEDEISEAVKQDNKEDTKLGFSTTVNQSWGTGSASATGSLNMDKTQEVARDKTEKRMRQQSVKLSTEIRQNYKTTLKTITEVSDTSSKRYVLNNTTKELINYELRRKMRQVGVQVQDIGTFLCWETFVDEPGQQLGLPNLIHIAKPADLILVPNPQILPMPDSPINIGFIGEMEWFFPDNQRQYNGPDGFFKMNTLSITSIPDGYEVANKGAVIDITQEVILMEDDDSEFFKGMGAKGKISVDGLYVEVGLILGVGGLKWDEGRIRIKVNGSIPCKLLDSKRKEIDLANSALWIAKLAADNENQRKQEEAFKKTAQERITLASKIMKRKFEDLREEERTIVYRNLIKSLMTEYNYEKLPDKSSARHVLSELINSIFDINKMLYFVAPEWWKPRIHNKLSIGDSTLTTSINGSVVNWADQQSRPDNYFITENSEPAVLGSSLGWLLQLDGDDLRNVFLNAPWVKAVIPIRPGKELAAINWLQNVNVEGADGLDAIYTAPDDELIRINVYLSTGKTPREFSDVEWTSVSETTLPNSVTIRQAIDFLCAEVTFKEDASKTVSKYPKEEINDVNKVLATPIEKVYEHGFYPLKGGFKAKVEDNFEIISQWIEVLPTDQIVPVEVKYDPKTGRQI